MKRRIGAWTLAVLLAAAAQTGAAELAGLDIHGFISQGFLKSDDNNYQGDSEDGSFQFNELGINFSKDLSDGLRIGLQLFSRDLGPVGNNAVEIDWAYGDYRWRDWLGARVGLMKMAHGLYNDTRDVDMLRTWILLPQSVYMETTRDYYTRMWGAELYGDIPLPSVGSVNYRALVGSYSPDADDSGLSVFIEDYGLPADVQGFDNGVQYNGSLQWHTPLSGLRLGVTHWHQKNFTADVINNVPLGPMVPAGTYVGVDIENEATVLSGEYVRDDLILAAEFRYRETAYGVANVLPRQSETSHAWYLSAAYRLSSLVELGAYYSESYPNKDDRDGDRFAAREQARFRAWQKDFALTTRLDLSESWTLKLEGHRMNGVADLFAHHNPDGFEEDWYLFATKMTFSF